MNSKISIKAALIILIVLYNMPAIAQTEGIIDEKMEILIHITSGPENPTKAALGFLVAKTAIEEGHVVTLFLAGDAVQLLRNEVLANLTGLGTGKLKDHYDAIVAGGGTFYLSGMSGNSRGVLEDDIKDKPAEFAQPSVLLQLAIDSDRMFVY
jgi:predicted peroxiredoxin